MRALLVWLCLSFNVYAKDLGVYGQTYNIIEPDLLQMIKDHLQQANNNGDLLKLKNKIIDQSKNFIFNPKPAEFISLAHKNSSYIFDPSITSYQEIKDAYGNIIIHKGQRVNPLDFISLKYRLLLIDGDDEKQVIWALSKLKESHNLDKIILTKGSPIKLMKKYKQRFYFDQNANISNYFKVKHNPALLQQENKLIRINEVLL